MRWSSVANEYGNVGKIPGKRSDEARLFEEEMMGCCKSVLALAQGHVRLELATA